MDTQLSAGRLRLMTNEPAPSRAERGERIKLHMRLIGITQRQLAEQVGISRVTVAKAIAGDPTAGEEKILAIEAFLAMVMEESGIDPTEPEQSGSGPLTFQMTTPDGYEFILSGPVEDADEMRRQITKLIAEHKDA